MTTVIASRAIDFANPGTIKGDVTVATSSEVAISDGDAFIYIFHGSGFQYSGENIIAGTVSSLNAYQDGANLFLQITGASVPAAAASQHVFAGDFAGLLASALTGNDTINGSAGDDRLFGYDGNDTVTGGTGNDSLSGGNGNDSLNGGLGANFIDGGAGIDTASYNGASTTYAVGFAGGQIHITNKDATIQDTLQNVERLKFAEGTLALDISGNAGIAYRIYQAAFDRTPDKAGLTYWVKQMDNGLSLHNMASNFIGSKEFTTIYGTNSTDQHFVETLYHNILGRDGETGGISYWDSQLGSGVSRADVLVGFSESAENVAGVSAAISNGIWLS